MSESKASSFITCNKRVNKPSIHVQVCINKCEHKETCPDYLAYSQISIFPDVGTKLPKEKKTA